MEYGEFDFMRKFVIALMLFTFAMGANAGEATLSWTPPTSYVDGSALPASEITSYKIYYGQTNGGPYASSVTVAGSFTSAVISGLAAGTWYFVATTVASNGQESAFSAQVSKTVVNTAKPNPPVLR
jgi:hypothetical protein